MKHANRTGFTLVELLVVMAIISVLAGLLLPALGSALASARTLRCMNNQKQLGMILNLYGDEYEGWLPLIYDDVEHVNWVSNLLIQGHLGERTSWKDWKANPAEFITLCPDHEPKVYGVATGETYGMPDRAFVGGEWIKTGRGSHNIYRYSKPSTQPLTADTVHRSAHTQAFFFHRVSTSAHARLIHTRHSDKGNILFGDMHVAGQDALDLQEIHFYHMTANYEVIPD